MEDAGRKLQAHAEPAADVLCELMAAAKLWFLSQDEYIRQYKEHARPFHHLPPCPSLFLPISFQY